MHLKKLIFKAAALLGETFWLVPGAMVLAGILAAILLIEVDRGGLVPAGLLASKWLYNGGGTGARTLLGAVAGSMIGVAGTVFSITIAALSLAAGQMGPRLLRNFTHDRGNQVTLGAFLATFCYALMVLRSVRTQEEGAFVPHLSLSVGILLAFLCVGTLVYFVGHMAGRINVDTVVELVGEDLRVAIHRLTTTADQPAPPPETYWQGAVPVRDMRRGYLQQLDEEGLATWAVANGAAIRLLVRPGDFVFPGAPIALVQGDAPACAAAIRDSTGLGPLRTSAADLEYAVRQLVEVAVRALSPGINDPHTAIGVLDRLGASLCDVACVRLPNGVTLRDAVPVLVLPAVDYDGLVDAMFHMIRQNAAGSVAVLMRLLEVLGSVASCEPDAARRATLRRHAGLVLEDARREVLNASDRAEIERRHTSVLQAIGLHDCQGPPCASTGT